MSDDPRRPKKPGALTPPPIEERGPRIHQDWSEKRSSKSMSPLKETNRDLAAPQPISSEKSGVVGEEPLDRIDRRTKTANVSLDSLVARTTTLEQRMGVVEVKVDTCNENVEEIVEESREQRKERRARAEARAVAAEKEAARRQQRALAIIAIVVPTLAAIGAIIAAIVK